MARPKAFDPDLVLDRAVEAFLDEGFEAAGITELLGRLGIGRQSLYDTFGGKQQLWEAALQRYRRREGAILVEVLGEADPFDALRQLLIGLVERACSDPRGCLVVTAATERAPRDKATVAQVAEQFVTVRRALRDTLDRGQTAGAVTRSRSPDEQAEFLLVLIQGLRVVGKVSADRAALDAAVDVALDGLRP